MKIVDYTKEKRNLTIPEYIQKQAAQEELLFFDIETTGFVARNTTLYLIGALWIENNQINLRQWFNDDGYSEAELLTSFLTFCTSFKALVHFNGTGFDLPYLNQKGSMHSIDMHALEHLIQIDIYKEIRSYKSLFGTDNLKQVSIEQFLGIHRKDTCNGKELIQVYQRFVAKPDDAKEKLLLLHNHDDLLGMPQISTILNYKSFMEAPVITDFEIAATNDRLSISFHTPKEYMLPRRLACTRNGIYLNALGQDAFLQIPILHATMKHFFTDYKNYYYLPAEDMAIHKSIAAYVESASKEKASRNTCYIKQNGDFIPCAGNITKETFQENYNSKKSYLLTDSLLQASKKQQEDYIKDTLLAFL